MNLEQLKARMAEIMGKLEALNGAESFEESQIDEVNALSEEYEKIEKQIEAQERVAALTAKAATSTRKVAPATSAVKIEMGKDRLLNDPKGGFKTAGEFFKTVKNQTFGQNDNRLQILAAGAYEKVAEDGGFLIPEDFRLEIQKKCDSDESLLAKCRQLKTNSNHLSLPTNESAPWDGTGIQAYWEGEGATLTESKAKFSKSNWHLHKLTALVRVSDELMDDASALGSWINAEAPAAIMHKINSAIISGSGAGMPTGFLNSGFKYEQRNQLLQNSFILHVYLFGCDSTKHSIKRLELVTDYKNQPFCNPSNRRFSDVFIFCSDGSSRPDSNNRQSKDRSG